jgi:hypothetical protein
LPSITASASMSESEATLVEMLVRDSVSPQTWRPFS